jgi:hypothetical protein
VIDRSEGKFMHPSSSDYSALRDDSYLFALLWSGAVLGSLAIAIAFIPNDPRPAGAMFWPALFLTLGLSVVPILRIRRAIGSMFRADNILMGALVYWVLLDPLQSAYPLDRVTYESVVMAMTAIATMAIGISLGAAGRGWRPPKMLLRATQPSFNDSSLFLTIWILFLLGMFYFAFSCGFDPSVMIDGLSKNRFAAPWSRGSIGDWGSFIEHMQYFGYVLPSLTVVLANRKGWIQPRVIISAALSLIMVMFLGQGGGRRVVGVILGAAVLNWVLLQRRLSLKLVIGLAVGAVTVLMLMHEMLEYRSSGFGAALSGKAPDQEFSYLHVDDNFLRLSQITMFFPDVQPYVGLQPITFALIKPVPRVFWPNKPIDVGYDLSKMAGVKGASLSQSIVGELYSVSGLLSVFLGGLFLGRLAGMWNKVLVLPGGTAKAVVWGLGIMILFAGIRSMQDLVIMSYGLFGWLIAAETLRRREMKHRVRVGG